MFYNKFMEWQIDTNLLKQLKILVRQLKLTYIDCRRIICVKSWGSVSRARARIWSFPKVWQLALNKPPHYVIEVLSKHFDDLPEDDKKRVLIHELLHIPKNFSGSLIPHHTKYGRIDSRRVEALFKSLKSS